MSYLSQSFGGTSWPLQEKSGSQHKGEQSYLRAHDLLRTPVVGTALRILRIEWWDGTQLPSFQSILRKLSYRSQLPKGDQQTFMISEYGVSHLQHKAKSCPGRCSVGCIILHGGIADCYEFLNHVSEDDSFAIALLEYPAFLRADLLYPLGFCQSFREYMTMAGSRQVKTVLELNRKSV